LLPIGADLAGRAVAAGVVSYKSGLIFKRLSGGDQGSRLL